MTAKQLAAANEIIAEQQRAIATMSNGNGAGEIMESVIIKGDLSKLSPEERSRYYMHVCKSVGLNPLTKPFEYISLNGKLTLYALRACTDQLRAIHKVSVESLEESERDGVFIVTAKMRNGEGRTDMAKGAVTIGSLKGDALANQIMKAETKAKRRATLSLCGLGFLDETEIETISEARPYKNAASSTMKKNEGDAWYKEKLQEATKCETVAEFDAWMSAHSNELRENLSEFYLNEFRSKCWDHKKGLMAGEKVKTSNLSAAIQGLKAGNGNGKPMPNPADNMKAWLAWVDEKMSFITTLDALVEFWDTRCAPHIAFPPDEEAALEIYNKHGNRIDPPREDEQA